ncbi:hypothetical protein G3A39_43365 [Paraburkholderia aspalathi]|nr:hypothetical protein [Paraburkholderia aspalathi]
MLQLLLPLMFGLLLSVPAYANSNGGDHPRFPMTSGWYNIGGKDNSEYTIYRKFTLIDPYSDAPIRNHYLLNCSSTDMSSYLTIVLPREIDFRAIIGRPNQNIRKFSIATIDSNGASHEFEMHAEVKGNELFFDFEGKQRLSLHRVLTAKSMTLFLKGRSMPLEFLDLGDEFTLPEMDETAKPIPFEIWVRNMMDRSGQHTKYVSQHSLYRECIDIGAWAKKSKL